MAKSTSDPTNLLNFIFAICNQLRFAVVRSVSLHGFLDSYLRFRNRWYDLPHRGPKGTIAGIVIGEAELSRRVFMVFYRM